MPAVAAVSVRPGCTEFTRMPSSPSSSAATRTSWSTAALPAAYDDRYRVEKTAAVDEMATNEPPPARTMACPAYFRNRNTGRTFWSTSALNWSSS